MAGYSNNKNKYSNSPIQATATYNFVPLSEKVILSEMSNVNYNSISNELKSGEIHLNITAKTPIYIADKANNDEFYKNANGEYEIPGSTLRGLIHNNMNILGYGKIADYIEDYKIYYRNITKNKSHYTNVLGLEQEKKYDEFTRKNKLTTLTNNVSTGYIVNENGSYYIYPTKGKVVDISQSHPKLDRFSNCYLDQKNVLYKDKDFNFSCDTPKNGYKKGVLLFTGKHIGVRKNPRYLFPEIDTSTKIKLTKEDILDYEIDYKLRSRVNKNGEKLWELPYKGEQKAVFYTTYNDCVYFGMSKCLRIGYKNNISKGIPLNHKTTETTFVDNILGFSNKDFNQKSKVSFGSCLAINAIKSDTFGTILGEPKLSFCETYLTGGDYNSDTFKIRGYKFYWLKELEIPEMNKTPTVYISPLKEGTKFKGIIRYKNLTEEELGLLLWSIRLEQGCYHSIGMGKSLGLGRVTIDIDKLLELNYGKEVYSSFSNPFQACSNDNISQYIDVYDKFAIKSINSNKQSIKDEDEIKNLIYIRKTIIKNTNLIKDMGLNRKSNKINPLKTISQFEKL